METDTKQTEDKGKRHLFIDLGNCHDVLPVAARLIEQIPTLNVYSYADFAFNGVGAHSKIPVKHSRIHYFQNMDEKMRHMPETTDAKLIWDVCRLIYGSFPGVVCGQDDKFFIASSDKNVQAVKPLVEECGYVCSIIKGLPELEEAWPVFKDALVNQTLASFHGTK